MSWDLLLLRAAQIVVAALFLLTGDPKHDARGGPSSSNCAARLVLGAVVICVAAALSPDAPTLLLVLTGTTVMTALLCLVSTP